MDDNQGFLSLYGKSPIYQLFISLFIVLGIGLLLLFVFLLVGIFIFDSDMEFLNNAASDVSEKNIAFLRYILISQNISLFIVPSVIILIRMKPANKTGMMNIKMPRINEIVLVLILSFCIFPITSFTGQLNSEMHLPDWLSGIERWMIGKEENSSRLIDLCMSPETFWVMIMNLFLIAVLPAIGEELIFRGVFQKIFCNLFKSGHLAVWVTAIIFSAIHFQFFGFIPRLILGLVFGYLFYWSGTLWLPMISHFVNNAVLVVADYINGVDNVNAPFDIPIWKQMTGLFLPVLIIIIILLYFRSKSKNEAVTGLNESQLSD